ncbi:DUF4381 domain-containing protein [Oligoflexaceae bacterium]|nr:DUF4381 domain-containing protein [Oligoflexaceae bacterium]
MNQESLPHDIYGLVASPTPWFYYLLGFLMALIVAGAIRWLWKRRRKPETSKEIAAIDPLQKCRAETRALQVVQPFSKKQQIDFYHRLSHLLREYIEHSFKLPATDLTTKELRAQLPQYSRIKHAGAILTWLESSDSVKFSDRESGVEEAEKSRDQVLKWMEDMLQPEVPGVEFTNREQA